MEVVGIIKENILFYKVLILTEEEHIMNRVFVQMIQNKILMTTLSAWIAAQTVKVITGIIRQKNLISAGLWEQAACLQAMLPEPVV